ncbi:Fic family protein [Marinomonas sp. GJ51-6]|uniref:Fic family protein n=1 Tax=Marinomonas sp. GJ51-6 TaxID=2992802 RepID=UPI0029350F6E|nr:Fic family protein [Marinomonas sp. GJ51-6]WOD08617.1 Fic family protein [Marinomonas sp. GJ51-6]
MIALPPKKLIDNPVRYVFQTVEAEAEAELAFDYLSYSSAVDSKGRYFHFDELKHRLPKKMDVTLVWSLIKEARVKQKLPLYFSLPSFCLTPTIQKSISEVDRNTTTAALEWMCNKIGERKHLEYLLNDLVEDEAISSSQLEGAATTTKVAKDMLKRSRKPRNPDEKMILGNFRMMKFAWEHKNKDLSVELIEELHLVGVEGIDDEKYKPGIIRLSDDVVVENNDGEVVHTPPKADQLNTRLNELVKWVNDSHHDAESSKYIHPLIKAITLHFRIGYEHPFHDGNGRVARALFYWYMFKNEFAAFRYIAISLLLKEAPVQYGKSYLYTETDDMDLTYFIDYQCRIIIRAINKFKTSYKESVEQMETFNKWLWDSGLYRKLTDKQQTVFQVAKSERAVSFTINNVKDNLGCSYNTAATTLNGLVEPRVV